MRFPSTPFLCILLLLLQLTTFAQKVLQSDALNRVTFNRQDTVYTFYTLRPVDQRAFSDKSYYWFKPDTILITTGGFDGKLLHGIYKVSYPNKNLYQQGLFSLGLKTGEWKSWYADGIHKTITHWKKGIQEGPFNEYDWDGKLVRDGNYKAGQLHGVINEYKSDTIFQKQYYKKGTLVIPRMKKKADQHVPDKKARQ